MNVEQPDENANAPIETLYPGLNVKSRPRGRDREGQALRVREAKEDCLP